MLGISAACHPEGEGTHSTCQGWATRRRPGITAYILYIHHPQPMPGESLTHTTARCACPCHNPPAVPPPGVLPN